MCPSSSKRFSLCSTSRRSTARSLRRASLPSRSRIRALAAYNALRASSRSLCRAATPAASSITCNNARWSSPASAAICPWLNMRTGKRSGLTVRAGDGRQPASPAYSSTVVPLPSCRQCRRYRTPSRVMVHATFVPSVKPPLSVRSLELRTNRSKVRRGSLCSSRCSSSRLRPAASLIAWITVDFPVPRPPTSALSHGLNSSLAGSPRPMYRASAISTASMQCSGSAKGAKGSGSSLRRIEKPPPSSNARRSPSSDGRDIFTHV